jgi:ribosomal protein L40E
VASEKGIESPWDAPQCLKCHVTAFGVDEASRSDKLTVEEGVSCEACHGAGSAYSGRKVMQDIFDGKKDGAEFGLVAQSEKVCLKCHNQESPTFKGFDYSEMVAKISHKTPR